MRNHIKANMALNAFIFKAKCVNNGESIITQERSFVMDFLFIFVINVTMDKTIKTIRGIISWTYNYIDIVRKKNTLSLSTLQRLRFMHFLRWHMLVSGSSSGIGFLATLYILYHLMQWYDTKSIVHCNIRHDYFYRLVKLQRSISAVMFVTFPFTYDFCMKEHFVYTFFGIENKK